jgi:DNA-binding CsgD family transcriptional regulator
MSSYRRLPEKKSRIVLNPSDWKKITFLTPWTEQLLIDLFNLTLSEALISVYMAEGLSLVEAARCMHVTEASARTYSKRVYEKTDVHSQSQLVALVCKISIAYALKQNTLPLQQKRLPGAAIAAQAS